MPSVVKKYQPKQKELFASKIDKDSINKIASWCGGTVKDDHEALQIALYGYPKYIELSVNYRVVRADFGDYVVSEDNKNFKVIPSELFESAFEAI